MSEQSVPAATSAPSETGIQWTPKVIALALIPLLLLLAVLGLILATDAGLGDRAAPPIETLSVQQVRLPAPGEIEVEVINDGPDDVEIVQVLVDDAYWQFSMSPDEPLERLESATISIPYPWVQDESHHVILVSSSGVLFDVPIEVAIESPDAGGDDFWKFGLVGLYVGVVPVALGLLWYPFMRRLGSGAMRFILALTIGLLLFLVVDMWEEAHETALAAPASLNATVLIPLVAILTAGILVLVGRSMRKRSESTSGLALAYQIAFGIGLHNLGEGLAIGTAFALGEAALGVFLIAGFTLHNVTEGVGIAAPLVKERPPLYHFLLLALLAGGPAIIGTWIGAFVYSPFWATIFLAIGIGAIAQVIFEIGGLIKRGQERSGESALDWQTLGGLAAGFAVMYATALLVAA